MENRNTRRAFHAMICTLLTLSCTAGLLAQERHVNPAHIGIVYPLSTNGKTAPTDTNNFSLHLIAGISQQENAFLVAGLSGIVRGNAYGTMISGVFNHVGNDAEGIQVAGILNHIKHHAKGVQIAGLANITGEANGLQVAGLMNRSGDVTTQVAGLINIAKKVKGVQIAGLINIAEESKYPIGILNIIKEGEMQIGLTVDEGGSTLVALRSGGKVLYGILGIGYNFKDDEARYVLEGGIGAHLIAVKAFRVNVELVSISMTDFDDHTYNKHSFRSLAGYRITPRVELFAGPTFNHLLFDADQRDIRNDRYIWKREGKEHFNGLFIGGIAGVQISL
ncbi:hypothetical protein [Parapedobacter tibetensis]|uniref:hypothetical protein n=1 Tax=Parapedobacter tibetensis TaxID=2972951 RepID=UPI00214DC2A9|nr:hypothetical protein [Parapedobacter tibetensis]